MKSVVSIQDMIMKYRVKYSSFATWLTVVLFVALFVGCIFTIYEKPAFYMLLFIYVVLIVSALLYGVRYVKIEPDGVIMGSVLRARKILIRDIESVVLFQPTMGAIRICASGGFMGYWGLFKERDIGRYYAFYGKASDCFLVKMKNGDKYVIGCEDCRGAVGEIKSFQY